MAEHEQAMCWSCGKEVPIGNGWDACSTVIPCPHCGAACEIHSDEDSDCDYWFTTEKPDGTPTQT